MGTMEKLAAQLPAGFADEWTGIAFQQEAAGNIAILIFALSVVFVFLVLAAQFESLLLPLAIILIVPMTLLAAMTGREPARAGQQHPDADRPDRAHRARREECDPDRRVRQAGGGARAHRPIEAAVEAARARLRPILMTSFAFILGTLPLVIASGPGWELRQALGTAVFFGMIGVTAFGLIFTPVFYVATRTLGEKLKRRGGQASMGSSRCFRRNEEIQDEASFEHCLGPRFGGVQHRSRIRQACDGTGRRRPVRRRQLPSGAAARSGAGQLVAAVR